MVAIRIEFQQTGTLPDGGFGYKTNKIETVELPARLPALRACGIDPVDITVNKTNQPIICVRHALIELTAPGLDPVGIHVDQTAKITLRPKYTLSVIDHSTGAYRAIVSLVSDETPAQ
jgi:hypothetical protein